MLLKTHDKLIQKCTEVSEIMQPILQKHGMTLFNYYKEYNDGRIIRLSTHEKWTENCLKREYYNTQYYNSQCYNSLSVLNDCTAKPISYIIWQIQDCPTVYLDAAINFNISNAITIVIKHIDFVEYYGFASTIYNTEIINRFYINNLDKLVLYCQYFKDKAKPIIQNCEKNKIILLNSAANVSSSPITLSPKELDNRQYAYAKLLVNGMKYNDKEDALRIVLRVVTKAMQLNKSSKPLKHEKTAFIYGNMNFTLREAQCLHYLLNNYSARKTADKLNISHKTVEFHISKIKNKINCHNITQITNKAIEEGFIDIMFMKFENV